MSRKDSNSQHAAGSQTTTPGIPREAVGRSGTPRHLPLAPPPLLLRANGKAPYCRVCWGRRLCRVASRRKRREVRTGQKATGLQLRVGRLQIALSGRGDGRSGLAAWASGMAVASTAAGAAIRRAAFAGAGVLYFLVSTGLLPRSPSVSSLHSGLHRRLGLGAAATDGRGRAASRGSGCRSDTQRDRRLWAGVIVCVGVRSGGQGGHLRGGDLDLDLSWAAPAQGPARGGSRRPVCILTRGCPLLFSIWQLRSGAKGLFS